MDQPVLALEGDGFLEMFLREPGLVAELHRDPVARQAFGAEVVDHYTNMGRTELEAFARAAEGGPPYPITTQEVIHGAAVTEAIIKSAAAGKTKKVA